MRLTEIQKGRQYLTRDVLFDGPFGRTRTRGRVEVLSVRGDGLVEVKWLMKDGTERVSRYIPRLLRARHIWTEIPA